MRAPSHRPVPCISGAPVTLTDVPPRRGELGDRRGDLIGGVGHRQTRRQGTRVA